MTQTRFFVAIAAVSTLFTSAAPAWAQENFDGLPETLQAYYDRTTNHLTAMYANEASQEDLRLQAQLYDTGSGDFVQQREFRGDLQAGDTVVVWDGEPDPRWGGWITVDVVVASNNTPVTRLYRSIVFRVFDPFHHEYPITVQPRGVLHVSELPRVPASIFTNELGFVPRESLLVEGSTPSISVSFTIGAFPSLVTVCLPPQEGEEAIQCWTR